MTEPDWRPLPEAAKVCGLTVDALRKRVARGTVEHARRGRSVFVDVSTIADAEPPPDLDAVAVYEERIRTLRAALERAEAESARERERAETEAERYAIRERALMASLEHAWRSVDALTEAANRALPPPVDEAKPKDGGRSFLDRLRGR